MDPSHLDDKMDVASSPFLQPDDLDVELDSVRAPSIIESLHDDMIDDAVQPADVGSDIMQDQIEDTLLDDDMIDDENATSLAATRDEDLNMDVFADEPPVDEDEDILYEDEEDIQPVAEQTGESMEPKSQQEPQQYQEAEAEVLLDDAEEQRDEQDPRHLITNEPEIETTTAPQDDLGDAGQESVVAVTTETDSSVNAAVQSDVQDGGDDFLEHEQTAQDNPTGASVELFQEDHVGEPYVELENVELAPENAETTEEAQISVSQEHNEAVPEAQPHDTQSQSEDQKESVKAVHPVTLLYLDEEMSLFPPMIGDESSVYFLADSSLAFEPLDKLLAACREILTGTLDHHDELVLDITALGLHICEDSKYAAQITLSQILDVYLQLCRNDAGHEIHPLYCHLSSRVSLASQYSYLVSSCNEGRTFSEIAADHIDTPEPEGELTDPANYHEEKEDYGDPEAPVEEQSNEHTSNEQPTTLEPELDHQSELARADHADPEETLTRSAGQALDATVPEEFPLGSAEQVNSSEHSQTQKTEQASAEDEAYPLDEEEQALHADGSGSEHEVHLDVVDHLEAQEHETNSSHTLEAEQVENETREGLADELGVEAHDPFDDSFEQVEDLFEHDGAVEHVDEDFDPYSDELLDQEAEDQDGAEQATPPHLDPAETASTEQFTNEHNRSGEDASNPADDEALSAPNGLDAISASGPEPPKPESPLTPSKVNYAKRKVDDDDELDLLDLDTPEPKRRRPS